MSSDMSDSGSSGLSDWALVNVQGEIEASDGDSSEGSIEMIGMEDSERDSVPLFNESAQSNTTSAEAVELEELMKKAADEEALTGGEENLRKSDISSSITEVLERDNLPNEKEKENLSFSKEVDSRVSEAGAMQSKQNLDASLFGHEEKTLMVKPDHQFEEELSQAAALKDSDGADEGRDQQGLHEDDFNACDHQEVSASDSNISVPDSASILLLSRPVVADSDNESDFVRLEKDSSCGNISGSDEDAANESATDAICGSVSSVGSGFNFLAESHAVETSAAARVLPPAMPLHLPLSLPSLLPPPPLVHNSGVQEDDADTESSTEQDQDDRTESEQSDDSNSFQADEQDQDLSVTGDIGDLPLENGGVERHYVHHANQQLNLKLNRVVLVAVLIALGLGLGHWIGSTREYLSQMTVQLDQMQRLHKMQDEYVQCLSRNEELLLFTDQALQMERNRHKEAMADLHDNNRELQEQLQDGQVQLETLLAQKVEAPFLSQLPLNDAGEKMMLSDLLFAGEEIFQRKAAKMGRELRSQLLQARAIIAHHSRDAEAFRREESRDSSTESEDLVRLRQHINQLEDDNAELRKMIGLYRYQHCPSICPVSEPTVLVTHTGVQDILTATQNEDEGTFSQNVLSDERSEEQELGINDDESSSPSIFTKESSWPDEMSTDSHSKHVNSERIRWENDDIPSDPDSDSANIQASYDTSNPRAIPVDVGLLQRNLTLERQRSEMWRRLYLKQQRESAKTGSSATKVNASACLQFIQQSFNTSSVLSILSHFNVSGSSIEDFTNLTYLMSSISQMHQNLLQSLPAFWDRVSTSLFDDGKEDDLSEEDVFVKGSGYKSREDSTSSGDAEREKAESVKRYWSDSVRNLLNKTKTTVSNVSEQLKQTWDRVKDASVSLWPNKDSMISRMAAHVKEGVTNFSKKMHDKASRWFDKYEKKHQKAKNKHPHVNIDKKRGHEILEEESKSSINANKKHGDDLFKHRKSTVTDPSMPRIDKIYPDRGSHFDNQAKHQVFRSDKSTEKATRKAEKRFSKLYHRLASMGQRRFAHLGDGDKKEILQDLQDLVDEQHKMGKKLSESGLALLNCQLEWWKGARRGNFIQRRQCLHYLAPWQHQISDSGDIHQTVHAANEKPHISHNGKLEENSKQKKVEDNKDAKERKGKRLEPVKLPEKNSSSAHADWLASQSQSKTVEPGEWLTTHERQAWYFEWVRGRDHLRQEEHRADWMFDRASDRDTNRQSAQTADWLFERAAMRDEARQNEDPENKNTRKFSKDYQSDQRDHQNYRQRYGHKARERQCS